MAPVKSLKARLPKPDDAPAAKPIAKPATRGWYARSAAVVRWLHIYISLLGFTALMFFAVTGVTLNHPTWFGIETAQTSEFKGSLETKWLRLPGAPASPTSGTSNQGEGEANGEAEASGEAAADAAPEIDPATTVDKFEIVEFLRKTHALRGAVGEFRVDDYECLIVFKGPGYSADFVVDRETGRYTATQTVLGVVAVMNDLHKGRDSGAVWSWVIDVSAIVTVLVSLTGIVLLFYIKRRRRSGLVTAVVGTLAMVLLYVLYVP